VLGAVLLQILPQAINFLNLPTSVTGPLQGLIFTGLVLAFLFLRPQGILGMSTNRAKPSLQAIPEA
jgi:branched-chain amino acid transport system permease protein